MEQMILKNKSYQLITVKNGLEGVEIGARSQTRPDFDDVVMPETNGFEMIRWLRQHDASRSVLIVTVSSLGTKNTVRAILSKGAKSSMPKPLQKDGKLATLKTVFQETGLAL